MSGLTLGSPEAAAALKACDVLVHLASTSLPGIGWNDPSAELASSTLPEVRFLQDFCRDNPRARIIHASSGGQIYGPGHDRPIPDTSIPAPTTAYALGKLMVEATLSLLSAAEGNLITILRIANPIGRWQLGRRHGFVTTAVQAGLAGKPLTLYGSGTNVRDYFDADDFADFLCELAFASTARAGTYNIGSDRGLTERDVITIVSRVTGRPLDISTSSRRPYDLEYALLDSQRARRELGWAPATSLETSILKIRDACFTP
ncbi:hypothetical protein AX289_28935 [Methylorubrum populi]|nr:hypothetical protein AX289_28935 [Methylorubrum populi]